VPLFYQHIDLRKLEPGVRDPERLVDDREFLQLSRPNWLVPAAELCQAIVREQEGPPLPALKWPIETVGIELRPRFMAAKTRPRPARICPCSSTSTGELNPNDLTDEAI
jgi:hypothetical protein